MLNYQRVNNISSHQPGYLRIFIDGKRHLSDIFETFFKPTSFIKSWLVVEPPLWKIWVRQLGWFFPIIWKVIKFLFQITNQVFRCYSRFPNRSDCFLESPAWNSSAGSFKITGGLGISEISKGSEGDHRTPKRTRFFGDPSCSCSHDCIELHPV